MDLILKYFPELSEKQLGSFQLLMEILPEMNARVNVISRKDIGQLEERHILHSLAIAKYFEFNKNCQVLDVGTGGGFPGIPLAILFPETSFTLLDSIAKKIRLVEELTRELKLENVRPLRARMEECEVECDFVVSRAVTAFPKLNSWTRKLIRKGQVCEQANGLISLKGGDLKEELAGMKPAPEVLALDSSFDEAFFSTKKIVYLKK